MIVGCPQTFVYSFEKCNRHQRLLQVRDQLAPRPIFFHYFLAHVPCSNDWISVRKRWIKQISSIIISYFYLGFFNSYWFISMSVLYFSLRPLHERKSIVFLSSVVEHKKNSFCVNGESVKKKHSNVLMNSGFPNRK